VNPSVIRLSVGPLWRHFQTGESVSSAELQAALLGWRRVITPQFRSAGVQSLHWDESDDASFHSAQVALEDYWSVRVLAAYENVGHFPPEALPPDLALDPAMKIIREDFLRTRHPQLHACELWLPVRCADCVTVQLPDGRMMPVGAVVMLRAELDQIRTRTLGVAARQDLAPCAADPARSPLQQGAARALGTWLAICDQAVSLRLPMALRF
jgi:hypothetical protein